jgi:uncharacterized protein DUF4136
MTLAKNLTRTLLVLAAAVVIYPSTAVAQTVNVDFDHQANFDRCTTYSWVLGQPARNPYVDARIVSGVDEALAAAHWRKVNDGASCLVMYQASVTEDTPAQTWGNGMGPGWTVSGGMPNVRVNRVLKGMLVVDIGDAETRNIIWRGVATDTVADSDEKNQKKLAEIMKIMFKDFPPSGASKIQ